MNRKSNLKRSPKGRVRKGRKEGTRDKNCEEKGKSEHKGASKSEGSTEEERRRGERRREKQSNESADITKNKNSWHSHNDRDNKESVLMNLKTIKPQISKTLRPVLGLKLTIPKLCKIPKTTFFPK